MLKDNNELCGIEPVKKEWVDDLVAGIERGYGIHIQKAILFGSRAINEHITWSDYDICFISADFKGMKPWERMEIMLGEWHGERPLEPICYTPEEFNTLKISLIDEIKNNGRIIYGGF
ncbi:MAG: nucleotidyltransferase domain-containing protein [Deltaproteobacteria bacterium]|nr:nucleotidyltransferase domain-containing protein [Deltaproteobacteria bacterium]